MSTNQKENQILWKNVSFCVLFHSIALHGLFYLITLQLLLPTYFWFFVLILGSTQGITSGVHRLWAHRSYKAKLPLRLLLAFFQTTAFQFSIWKWARDHRVHHKYSDTDADPHNSNRGFFFSHVGWLLVEPHSEYTKRCKEVDCSDLKNDPVVYYQNKYFLTLAILCCLVIPAVVPWYFWNESLYKGFATAGMLRYIIVLHFTWLINSVAHMYGYKPYDKNIKASQNWAVSVVLHGEGWHNYHHTFPWDYKAEELGGYFGNWSTAFIDFMEKIGLAYDLKTAGQKLVEQRMRRTGQAQ